jgi:adenine-specific DNA-methyltransferase
VRYYGGKTKLLNFIEYAVNSLNLQANASFFDVFSGTAVVGKHFKAKGYQVFSNDFLEFAYSIASTFIEINSEPNFKDLGISSHPVDYLNELQGDVGFLTRNYSPYQDCERMYLSVDNAMKVDVIREKIEDWYSSNKISIQEKNYLITSLIEAINLRSNVTGTYAAFLKTWDSRALKPIILSKPEIISSVEENRVFKEDANEVVRKHSVDLLYLDPPYNSRQYASNYFFLELVAEGWFKNNPQIYGLSGMRPYDHQKSAYSSIRTASSALQDLVDNANTKYILLSYNNEGLIPHDEIKDILSRRGTVSEFSIDHKRYRAINQDGTNIKTRECLFLLKVEK